MGRICKPWPTENLWWSSIKGKDELELCQPRHLSGYQWPGNYSWNCIYIWRLCLQSTVWIGIRKRFNHSDLNLWSPNIKREILLTDLLTSLMVLVRRMYVSIKSVEVHFCLIFNNFDDWFCSLLGLQGEVGAQRILSILQINLKQSTIATGNS